SSQTSRNALRNLNARDDARDAHAKVLAEYNHFALGESAIGDIQVDWLARESLELHHGAAAKAQNVLHRHAPASELDRERQREIHQHRERHFRGAWGPRAQLGEIRGALRGGALECVDV